MRKIGFLIAALIFMTMIFSCRGRRNQEISGTGTIEATEVNVSSKVSGNVLLLFVDEGSRVKEGDTLAEIDHTVYDLQLKQAEAGLEMAKANLKVIEDNYRSVLKLYKQGTSTQKQRDELETRYKVAQAQYNSTQAMVDLAKQMISYCHIIAPAKGIITHKLVEIGELVGPGVGIVTISQLEKVKLTIYVTEKELGLVKIGQPAEVMIDSYPKRIFPGKVIYISPEAEFTPKNIQTKEERVKLVYGVKIEVENQDLSLKASMPADAVIKINR